MMQTTKKVLETNSEENSSHKTNLDNTIVLKNTEATAQHETSEANNFDKKGEEETKNEGGAAPPLGNPKPPPPLPRNYVDKTVAKIPSNSSMRQGPVSSMGAPSPKTVWTEEKHNLLELQKIYEALNPPEPAGWIAGQLRAPTAMEIEAMNKVIEGKIELPFIPSLFRYIFKTDDQAKAYMNLPRPQVFYITCAVVRGAQFQQLTSWMIRKNIESADTFHKEESNKKAVTSTTQEFLTECIKMEHIGSSLVFGFRTRELAEKWGKRGMPYKGTYLNFNANNRGSHAITTGLTDQVFGFSLVTTGVELSLDYLFSILTLNLHCTVVSLAYNLNHRHWNWGGIDVVLKGKSMPAWLRGKRMINLNGKALPIVQRDGQPPCFRCGTPGQKIASCPCRLNPNIRHANTLVLTEATQEACGKRLQLNEATIWDWKEMMAAAGEMTETITVPQELVPPIVPVEEADKLFEPKEGASAEVTHVANQSDRKVQGKGGNQLSKPNGAKPGGTQKIATKNGPKTSIREAACYAAATKEWEQVVSGKGTAKSTIIKKGVATLQEELDVLGRNQFAMLQAMEMDSEEEEEDEDSESDPEDTTMEHDGSEDDDYEDAVSENDSFAEPSLRRLPLSDPLEQRTKLKRSRKEVQDINQMTLQQVIEVLQKGGYTTNTAPITDHTSGVALQNELVQYPGDAMRMVITEVDNKVDILNLLGVAGLAQIGYHWATADLLILARHNVEECQDEEVTLQTEKWGAAIFRALQQGSLHLHTLMRTDEWWKHILPPAVHEILPKLTPGELLLHEDSMGMMLFVAALVATRGFEATDGVFPRLSSPGYVFRLETSTFQLYRNFPILHPVMAQFGYLHSEIFRQIVTLFLDQDFEGGLELLSNTKFNYDGTTQSSTSRDSASSAHL